MYPQSLRRSLCVFQGLDSFFGFMSIQSMASMQQVKAGRHTYYRIVESRRVHGKPRPIPLLHLGTADQLLNRLLPQTQPRCTLRSYQQGDVAALKAMADRLALVPLIDPHSPPSPPPRGAPLPGARPPSPPAFIAPCGRAPSVPGPPGPNGPPCPASAPSNPPRSRVRTAGTRWMPSRGLL